MQPHFIRNTALKQIKRQYLSSRDSVLSAFPRFKEIHQSLVPKQLYIEGTLPPADIKHLCIVGARKHTPYGKEVCEFLIKDLARLCYETSQQLIIVSGLALGIDAIAHKAALAANKNFSTRQNNESAEAPENTQEKHPPFHIIAAPGSGLDSNVLYPRTNRSLAAEILAGNNLAGEKNFYGALISEYEPQTPAAPWMFPERNRIMAGISDAVLVIEAAKNSGTLITAYIATDYGKDILAVPGSLFSPLSRGPHDLIAHGAHPAHTAEIIFRILDMKLPEKQEEKMTSLKYSNSCNMKIAKKSNTQNEVSDENDPSLFQNVLTEKEQIVYDIIETPIDKASLVNILCEDHNFSVSDAHIAISMLELKDFAIEKLGLFMRA